MEETDTSDKILAPEDSKIYRPKPMRCILLIDPSEDLLDDIIREKGCIEVKHDSKE